MKDVATLKRYYHDNLAATKIRLRKSVSDDNFIRQCVSSIEETEKAANLLSKRLREWYELGNPEFSRQVGHHESFVTLILDKKDVRADDSMGAEWKKGDYEPVIRLAEEIASLYRLRGGQETYLEAKMIAHCPNITAVAGSLIGARLLSHAGTLKRLSQMTASRIQLLGAEKALFRHMKTGSKAPKHGFILQHALVQKAIPKERGRAARALADKIAIAAKVDYFRGEFVGDRLKHELDKRLASIGR